MEQSITAVPSESFASLTLLNPPSRPASRNMKSPAWQIRHFNACGRIRREMLRQYRIVVGLDQVVEDLGPESMCLEMSDNSVDEVEEFEMLDSERPETVEQIVRMLGGNPTLFDRPERTISKANQAYKPLDQMDAHIDKELDTTDDGWVSYPTIFSEHWTDMDSSVEASSLNAASPQADPREILEVLDFKYKCLGEIGHCLLHIHLSDQPISALDALQQKKAEFLLSMIEATELKEALGNGATFIYLALAGKLYKTAATT